MDILDYRTIRAANGRTAAKAVRRFEDLYDRTFRDPETAEPAASWRAALDAPTDEARTLLHLAIGQDATGQPAVAGGVLAEWYPASGTALVSYIAVERAVRGLGIGRRLLGALVDTLRVEAARDDTELRGLFAETERLRAEAGPAPEAEPDPERESPADAAARLAALSRLGARWIDIPYVQPPVARGRPPSEKLLLLSFPVGDDSRLSIEDGVVRGFLESYVGPAARDDEAVAASLKAMQTALGEIADDGRVPYRQLPHPEASNVRATRAAFTLHFLTDERPEGAERGRDDGVGTTWTRGDVAYDCPYFRSFEADVLSFRYEPTDPGGAVLDSSCVAEHPVEVTVRTPAEIDFCSEGRWMQLVTARTQVRALATLTSTRFARTGVRIWHLTLRPAPGEHFTEHDLIRLTKLYSPSREETGLHHDTRFEYGGEPYRLADLVRTLSERLDPGGHVAEVAAPRAGTLLLDPRAAEGLTDEVTESLFALLHRIRQDDLIEAAEIAEVFGRGDDGGRAIRSLSGIVEGIFDYLRAGEDEVLDAITPNVPVSPDVLTIRKGTLIDLNLFDDLFDNEVCMATIGTSPYLLAAHSVLLHNELVLARAERALDAAAAETDPVALARRVAEVEWLAGRALVPNVFQYDTERAIVETGEAHRGLREATAQIEAGLVELRSRIGAHAAAADRRQALAEERRTFGLTALLGFLGLTAVVDFFEPFGDLPFRLAPPTGPSVVAVVVSVLLVAATVNAFPRKK